MEWRSPSLYSLVHSLIQVWGETFIILIALIDCKSTRSQVTSILTGLPSRVLRTIWSHCSHRINLYKYKIYSSIFSILGCIADIKTEWRFCQCHKNEQVRFATLYLMVAPICWSSRVSPYARFCFCVRSEVTRRQCETPLWCGSSYLEPALTAHTTRASGDSLSWAATSIPLLALPT